MGKEHSNNVQLPCKFDLVKRALQKRFLLNSVSIELLEDDNKNYSFVKVEITSTYGPLSVRYDDPTIEWMNSSAPTLIKIYSDKFRSDYVKLFERGVNCGK